MPELPEVETIVRRLHQGSSTHPTLIGYFIMGTNLLWPKSLAYPQPSEFISKIQGQGIVSISRRGKYLIFNLTQDTLLIHLRMSGDLQVETNSNDISPHHRVIFELHKSQDEQLRLSFVDPRKFGRIWFITSPEDIIGSLGPEPLEDSFTSQLLYDKLHGYRRQLKPLLMDQHFIAGLGNIYTDEALHLAQLHPCMLSTDIDQSQVIKLHKAIQSVLTDGIERNGASIDWVYRGGKFQNYFRVYQRTGLACFNCGTPIQRIIVGQRGTHFCPKCQSLF